MTDVNNFNKKLNEIMWRNHEQKSFEKKNLRQILWNNKSPTMLKASKKQVFLFVDEWKRTDQDACEEDGHKQTPEAARVEERRNSARLQFAHLARAQVHCVLDLQPYSLSLNHSHMVSYSNDVINSPHHIPSFFVKYGQMFGDSWS